MSRVLFAAARGARIEIPEYGWDGLSIVVWRVSAVASLDYINKKARINPDDMHLQYGPISSCVRDAALAKYHQYGGTYTVPYGSFWLPMGEAMNVDEAGELHRSLFLLILAEAMADEGL